MWYDCFWPKPNVRRKCSFIHIQRQNRNRNSVDLYSFSRNQHLCITVCTSPCTFLWFKGVLIYWSHDLTSAIHQHTQHELFHFWMNLIHMLPINHFSYIKLQCIYYQTVPLHMTISDPLKIVNPVNRQNREIMSVLFNPIFQHILNDPNYQLSHFAMKFKNSLGKGR